MTVETSTEKSFSRVRRSPLGCAALENTTGHRSLGEGPNKNKILQVSQTLKPPLEESTTVQCKVVKDTPIRQSSCKDGQ